MSHCDAVKDKGFEADVTQRPFQEEDRYFRMSHVRVPGTLVPWSYTPLNQAGLCSLSKGSCSKYLHLHTLIVGPSHSTYINDVWRGLTEMRRCPSPAGGPIVDQSPGVRSKHPKRTFRQVWRAIACFQSVTPIADPGSRPDEESSLGGVWTRQAYVHSCYWGSFNR